MSSPSYVNEPVVIRETDGKVASFIPKKIKNNRKAYAASLNMIFKHVADFHITVLDIISDKFGIDVDEMLNEVHNDERFKQMPNIFNAMGYLEEDDDNEEVEKKCDEEELNEVTNMVGNIKIEENTPPETSLDSSGSGSTPIQKSKKIKLVKSINKKKIVYKTKEEK